MLPVGVQVPTVAWSGVEEAEGVAVGSGVPLARLLAVAEDDAAVHPLTTSPMPANITPSRWVVPPRSITRPAYSVTLRPHYGVHDWSDARVCVNAARRIWKGPPSASASRLSAFCGWAPVALVCWWYVCSSELAVEGGITHSGSHRNPRGQSSRCRRCDWSPRRFVRRDDCADGHGSPVDKPDHVADERGLVVDAFGLAIGIERKADSQGFDHVHA